MATKSPLVVCLCIEDLDCAFCDIVINQIATGHFFGPDQPFHLVFHGTNDVYKLGELCQEVQDCAFPMITDVSWQTTFNEPSRCPDIVLVLLSCRSVLYTRDKPTVEQFQSLLNLVSYMSGLSDLLSVIRMDALKIIIAGDLALTAASIMSHRMNTLTARQLLAIDVYQNSAASDSGYSKVSRICDTVRQWWTGIKTSASTYLGVKYINYTKRATRNQQTGYFFSAPVNMTGPMSFLSDKDTPMNRDFLAEVKATTDAAFSLLYATEGQHSDSGRHQSSLCLSYL
ncbi:unnamed protein product [Candidula unifasciata]|uniref:Uncharacterized protein n=1 Tax=Candidula unifasciata TaxID=100452 RepID=A0A8S3YIZ3_9EUPU|nr:unnamed protein product [Candidula unifasciata]